MRFDLISVDRCEESDIILIGRSEENQERYKFNITDFFPYFYVREEAEIPDSKYIKEVIEDTGKKGLLGHDLKKIVLINSKKTPDVRDMFDISYEADILFNKRFRYDTGMRQGFRIDDEVLEEGKVKNGDNNIVNISWRDINGF